jgi:hypothetical protein
MHVGKTGIRLTPPSLVFDLHPEQCYLHLRARYCAAQGWRTGPLSSLICAFAPSQVRFGGDVHLFLDCLDGKVSSFLEFGRNFLMKTPQFLLPYVEGHAPTRLIQGLIAGSLATMIIGFGWGGWDTGGTVTEKVDEAAKTATVAALSPICIRNFKHAVKDNQNLVDEIKAVSSWQRDDYLIKAGYLTFPGEAKPNSDVASNCARELTIDLKLN